MLKGQVKEGPHGLLKHNEIIGNFFHESLVGLVAETDTPENKLQLLALHNFMKHVAQKDLPMAILNKGQIVWRPDLKEVARLANEIPAFANLRRVGIKNKPKSEQHKIYQEFLNQLGYQLKSTAKLKHRMTSWSVNAIDLSVLKSSSPKEKQVDTTNKPQKKSMIQRAFKGYPK